TCFRSSLTASPPPLANYRQTNTPASRLPIARIAAVSCAASAMSSDHRAPPFAATRHDHESRPDLVLRRLRAADTPAPTLLAFAAPLHPLRPQAPHRHPFKERPNPRRRLNGSMVSSRQRLENQNRSGAFPIAANWPAASFNPAYVRSPFVGDPTRAPATSHNPPDSRRESGMIHRTPTESG